MEAFGIGQDEHMSEEKNFKILQNTPTGIVIEAKGDRLILGPSGEMPSPDTTAICQTYIPSAYFVQKVYYYTALSPAIPGFSYGDAQHATLIWT